MIIHSSYGSLAYRGIATSSVQRQEVRTAAAMVADPAKNAEKISLSRVGEALAASDGGLTQPTTPAQEKLILAASLDSQSAEKVASDMAVTPSAIAWDISGQRGVGDGTAGFARKLASSGEIVDDNYISQFNGKSQVVDAQRRAIYDTEKAKGTDPLLILAKMINFTNSQSKDYLDATGWG